MTPYQLDDNIAELCESIVPGGKPVFVNVRPSFGAEFNNCTENVDRVIGAGQTRQLGWLINQVSGRFLEAIFHAVLRNQDETFLDVTPHGLGEHRILFLPDPKLGYEGFQIASRFRLLSNSPLDDQYVEASRRLQKLQNEGSLKEFHGATEAHGKLAAAKIEFDILNAAINGQAMESRELEQIISGGRFERNERCPCGSQRKFKKCHGK